MIFRIQGSEYDELLSEKESRKTTINRVVVVKE